MLVLDTDHLAALERGSAVGIALQRRLEDASVAVATAIISVEEQLRGWLAQLHRHRDLYEHIALYQRLHRRIAFCAAWHVLSWDTRAAEHLFIICPTFFGAAHDFSVLLLDRFLMADDVLKHRIQLFVGNAAIQLSACAVCGTFLS
jgi:hypothetical protein